MKRILITGASGFLGQQVIPMLEPLGFEIHTAGRSSASSSAANITHHRCSLLETDTAESLIRSIRPTHLIHLAWCADAGSFWHSPDNLKWLSASARLFESFAQNDGQRAVGVGSCAEYDWSSDVDLSEFASPGQPSTLYGQSKRAAGEWLQAFSTGSRMSAAWGRLFFLYGPAGHPQRVPGAMFESLLNGQPTPCPSGTHLRDYLFVRDAAAALVKLLESNVCGPVNIASGQAIRVSELIQAAAVASGNPHLLRVGQTPTQTSNNPERIVADISRLQNEVGFQPTVSLSSGMAETVAWWRKNQKVRAA